MSTIYGDGFVADRIAAAVKLLRETAQRVFDAGPLRTQGGHALLLSEYSIGPEPMALLEDAGMPAPHKVDDSEDDGHIHRSFALLLAAEVLERG